MGSRCNKKVLLQIRDFDHMAVLRLNFCLSKSALAWGHFPFGVSYRRSGCTKRCRDFGHIAVLRL